MIAQGGAIAIKSALGSVVVLQQATNETDVSMPLAEQIIGHRIGCIKIGYANTGTQRLIAYAPHFNDGNIGTLQQRIGVIAVHVAGKNHCIGAPRQKGAHQGFLKLGRIVAIADQQLIA